MRKSIFLRLAAWLPAALVMTACAQRASTLPTPDVAASDEPPLACVRSDTGSHRLIVAAGQPGTSGRVGGIVRGTDHELIRNASVITLQPIGGGSTLRARADSSGRFVVPNVAAGSYELRVVSIGYLTSRDTIAVPPAGLSLDVTQVIMSFLDEQAMCGYLAAVDSEPPLAPARGQTIAVTHLMPGGGSVRTTLVVRPQADGATFELSFRNVGNTPVDFTRLCYPSITGNPVRRFAGRIGPACYGTGMKLAPGDSLAIAQSVQLRGKPGDYPLRVHAVDPPALDAVVTLPLVPGHSPRS